MKRLSRSPLIWYDVILYYLLRSPKDLEPVIFHGCTHTDTKETRWGAKYGNSIVDGLLSVVIVTALLRMRRRSAS